MKKSFRERQPVLTVAFITSFVSALILVLTEFGVGLTPGQQSAIMGLVAIVAPVVAGLVARHFVYPATKVREERVKRYGH